MNKDKWLPFWISMGTIFVISFQQKGTLFDLEPTLKVNNGMSKNQINL
jgi:hypothetical protein